MRTLFIPLCVAVSALEPRAVVGSDGATGSPVAPTAVVERFLRSAGPRLVSYRARRTLEASALGGRVSGSMVADTRLEPDGTFHFEVVQEEGSSIIRDRVLRAALETEERSYAQHQTDAVALTRENYDFRLRGGTAADAPLLELMPKRRDKMLLNGHLVLTPSADLLRLEGSPTELPSYWTRQVTIVFEYARIQGVRVTTDIRSRADVRLVGESSFSMTYAYTSINGRAVRIPAVSK